MCVGVQVYMGTRQEYYCGAFYNSQKIIIQLVVTNCKKYACECFYTLFVAWIGLKIWN